MVRILNICAVSSQPGLLLPEPQVVLRLQRLFLLLSSSLSASDSFMQFSPLTPQFSNSSENRSSVQGHCWQQWWKWALASLSHTRKPYRTKKKIEPWISVRCNVGEGARLECVVSSPKIAACVRVCVVCARARLLRLLSLILLRVSHGGIGCPWR